MRRLLKETAIGVLSCPPVWGVLRRRALRGNPLTILCYHTLGPDRGGPDAWTVLTMDSFRRQIAILRRHYDIVSLDDALDGPPGTRPRAVLTFDDGEAGMHRYLLPFVTDQQLPVTVYVATGQIESGRAFWFDRVMNALQTDQPRTLDLSAEGAGIWQLPARDGTGRWHVLGALLERMKLLPPAQREELTARIEHAMPPPASNRCLAPMTLGELAELARSPYVTIGAHSHGHELLDQIPPEDARGSIAHSRELLRAWTGQTIAHFAYPNGNHSPELAQMIADLGFRSATVLGMDLASRADDPFMLPRLAIGRYDDTARFRLRLARL